MIVTKSWLNEWIDLSGISTEEIAKTCNSIGLEVDSIKEYRVPKKIVFGHVLECEKHPNADKLNICKVDIGSSIRQIVCGASNVRAGLAVVVATNGAVMPNGLAIKPVKLRGVDSEGMICSAKEIGLEDCQEGIVELDNSIGEYALGQEVSENPIFNDDLIEIELTANRGDCLSIRGVARDLSAAFDRAMKNHTAEDNDNKRGVGRILTLSHDKDLDVNLNYKVLELKELHIPFVMKLRLAQIQEQKKSDIESVLSYATHSSGVVLTAYNYECFIQEKSSIAKIELNEDEKGFACIVGKNVSSIVGVIQNKSSKVNYNEGKVIIEASYISPDVISKKMAEHKIESSDIFYKTSRGSEPAIETGLSYAINLIESNSKSSAFGGSLELGKAYKSKIISVNKDEINSIIGANIDKMVINKILQNLDFDTTKSSTDNFVISVPPFRHDIVNKQDIIEEIVRMVGIDNIPSKPFVLKEENRLESNYFDYKKRTIFRHRAAQSGFFETVHFIFDEKEKLHKYGFETTKEGLELLNPIVQTLDTLRPTLLTGLLKAASSNVKNGYSTVELFEVGSVFSSLRDENIHFAMISSGYKESDSLSNGGKPEKIDFAYFSKKLADIIGGFELREYETIHTLSHNYQCAQVIIDDEKVGEIFKVHPAVANEYDLDDTFMCEIEFEKIPYELKTAKVKSKYQASFRDLSIVMPQNLTYAEVIKIIQENATDELVRFYPVDQYEDASLGENVSLSIRFVLQSDEKTLEEEDITTAMDNIIHTLHSELGIELR